MDMEMQDCGRMEYDVAVHFLEQPFITLKNICTISLCLSLVLSFFCPPFLLMISTLCIPLDLFIVQSQKRLNNLLYRPLILFFTGFILSCVFIVRIHF